MKVHYSCRASQFTPNFFEQICYSQSTRPLPAGTEGVVWLCDTTAMQGVTTENILGAADWSTKSTFQCFYRKPI